MARTDEHGEPGFLSAGGELARLIAAFDWPRTTLGPIELWPEPVRTVVGMILRSPQAIVTLWGEPGVMIYNDAYSIFAGARHPDLLGTDVREAWPEVADFNDHIVKTVFGRGETLQYRDQRLILHRPGRPDEAWLDLSYSPVTGEDGTPLGVIAIVVETTERVVADRRLKDERIRLEQMYEQSPSFMALLDGADHRFVIANAAYQRLIGHREVLGRTLAEALPDAVAQGYLDLLDRVFQSGEAVTRAGARYDMQAVPGGEATERFVDFVFQPIRGTEGKVTRHLRQRRRRHRSHFGAGGDPSQRSAVPHLCPGDAEPCLDRAARRRCSTGSTTASSNIAACASEQLLGSRLGQTSSIPTTGNGRPRDGRNRSPTAAPMRPSSAFATRDGRVSLASRRARCRSARDDGQILRWIGTNTDIHDQKLAEVETTRDRDRLWTLSRT